MKLNNVNFNSLELYLFTPKFICNSHSISYFLKITENSWRVNFSPISGRLRFTVKWREKTYTEDVREDRGR